MMILTLMQLLNRYPQRVLKLYTRIPSINKTISLKLMQLNAIQMSYMLELNVSKCSVGCSLNVFL